MHGKHDNLYSIEWTLCVLLRVCLSWLSHPTCLNVLCVHVSNSFSCCTLYALFSLRHLSSTMHFVFTFSFVFRPVFVHSATRTSTSPHLNSPKTNAPDPRVDRAGRRHGQTLRYTSYRSEVITLRITLYPWIPILATACIRYRGLICTKIYVLKMKERFSSFIFIPGEWGLARSSSAHLRDTWFSARNGMLCPCHQLSSHYMHSASFCWVTVVNRAYVIATA